MDIKKLVPALEAVLFSSGDPMSIDRLSQVFNISPEKVEQAADALSKRLDDTDSGTVLLRLENTYQLSTRAEFAEYIKSAFDMRRKTPLSPAAFEVLAVIAYNQPVTRAFVEQVRGVDCSGVITTLLEKGLIEERGRLELPGKPLLYGTTKTFLRCFGLNDLSDLPPLPRAETGENDIGEQMLLNDDVMEILEETGE